MPVKITQLDWNAGPAVYNVQVAGINSFLSNKTLNRVAAVEEYIIAEYQNGGPNQGWEVKLWNLPEVVQANGIAATETTIQNFFVGKTLHELLNLDDGWVLAIYEP